MPPRLVSPFLLSAAFLGSQPPSRQDSRPSGPDESAFRRGFEGFVASLDVLAVARDHPGEVRKLLSAVPERRIEAARTLAETGEVEAIPWLLPFLEADDASVRAWTAASIERLVAARVLQRRDPRFPGEVVFLPPRAGDPDLRLLAWIALKMLRAPDDGNTRAHGASLARALELHDLARDLEECLESRHPAVANAAREALDSLARARARAARASAPASRAASTSAPAGTR